jgi:hypothetical protein
MTEMDNLQNTTINNEKLDTPSANNLNDERTDFELDLAIVADYVFDNIDNIESETWLTEAKELLQRHNTANGALEQAHYMIKILTIFINDVTCRFYEHQQLIQKQLQRVNRKVKNCRVKLEGEFGASYDFVRNIIML